MIDWDDVTYRSVTVIEYILIGIFILFVALFATSGLIIIIFGGLALTLQGLWFFGVPIFAVGVVLTVSTIVFVFAKIMSFIQKRR